MRTGCSNCVRFGLPCTFATASQNEVHCTQLDGDSSAPAGEDTAVLRLQQRGRGRPRRDWSATQPRNDVQVETTASTRQKANLEGDSRTNPSPSPVTSCIISLEKDCLDPMNSALNLAQAELLYHFIACTGPGLSGSDDPTHPITLFWTKNSPQIGFKSPWVLHLILSLAAYHLAYLTTEKGEARSQYLLLAKNHSSLGLKGTNEALSSCNISNCGSIYVSMILIWYCTFAGGLPQTAIRTLACG